MRKTDPEVADYWSQKGCPRCRLLLSKEEAEAGMEGKDSPEHRLLWCRQPGTRDWMSGMHHIARHALESAIDLNRNKGFSLIEGTLPGFDRRREKDMEAWVEMMVAAVKRLVALKKEDEVVAAGIRRKMRIRRGFETMPGGKVIQELAAEIAQKRLDEMAAFKQNQEFLRREKERESQERQRKRRKQEEEEVEWERWTERRKQEIEIQELRLLQREFGNLPAREKETDAARAGDERDIEKPARSRAAERDANEAERGTESENGGENWRKQRARGGTEQEAAGRPSIRPNRHHQASERAAGGGEAEGAAREAGADRKGEAGSGAGVGKADRARRSRV